MSTLIDLCLVFASMYFVCCQVCLICHPIKTLAIVSWSWSLAVQVESLSVAQGLGQVFCVPGPEVIQGTSAPQIRERP